VLGEVTPVGMVSVAGGATECGGGINAAEMSGHRSPAEMRQRSDNWQLQ
jgi:hypothetical protein